MYLDDSVELPQRCGDEWTDYTYAVRSTETVVYVLHNVKPGGEATIGLETVLDS